MICIHPDVIEKMPNSCADCVFAYYDETHGDSFYCGVSRFTINKERKNRTRHKGCGIYDPNYGAEDKQKEEKKKEVSVKKERTYEDIIEEAKIIRDGLNDHGLNDEEIESGIELNSEDNTEPDELADSEEDI